MDMVERVARAICTAMGEEPNCTEEHCLPGSYHTDAGEPHWRGYNDHARAAIEAMREPTREMALEGHGWVGAPSSALDAKRCWQAMVDEGLKSAKPSAKP